MPKEYIYYVKGMHCASCELLIEKALLKIDGVKSVEAKMGKGEVVVVCIAGKKPEVKRLNKIFRKENYVFSEHSPEDEESRDKGSNGLFAVVFVSVLLIFGFLLVDRSGLAGFLSVSSQSVLPAFFFFGLLAGVSSCAALVGGIVLSMSKQWLGLYSSEESVFRKLQPHLMFNSGRLVFYALGGAVLGMVGERLQISLKFTSFLIIGISVFMFLLALQMLGVKSLSKFQFALPKSMTRYVADESNFKGRYMPFVMGALTFFLPCGFTITAQSLALVSGGPFQGGLIMLFFALGTLLPLLFIGFSSIKFSQKPHLAYRFSRIAGILVLFFALFNFNSQLNVLGYSSLTDIASRSIQSFAGGGDTDPNVEIFVDDGKQVIKMDALSSGYKPNYFKVKVGVPVRWEITDKGTSGCTNAIISRGLFTGEIALTSGRTSVKEFTPTKTGKYKFSCWMGMVSGIIEVVEGDVSVTEGDFVSLGTVELDGACGVNGECVHEE